MSKRVAQSERLTVPSTKNAAVFRMILISLIHITDTERKIPLNIRKFITRNTQITGAVVILELRKISLQKGK